MRSAVVLLPDDVAWLLRALRLLGLMAQRLKIRLPAEVADREQFLQDWLAGHGGGHASVTKRPPDVVVQHDQDTFVTTEEAARMLKLTRGAVAKRCRAGVFAGVAHKHRGDWQIPLADVQAQIE